MKQIVRTIPAIAIFAGLCLGESVGAADAQAAEAPVEAEVSTPGVVVPAGTRVPLVMINSISSKHSEPGDPVYLESVYPVVVDGRIMIPAGTNVSGTVIHSKRPGRVKGRGQLGIRLDQMILPNGVIRDLSGRPAALDGRSPRQLRPRNGHSQVAGHERGRRHRYRKYHRDRSFNRHHSRCDRRKDRHRSRRRLRRWRGRRGWQRSC